MNGTSPIHLVCLDSIEMYRLVERWDICRDGFEAQTRCREFHNGFSPNRQRYPATQFAHLVVPTWLGCGHFSRPPGHHQAAVLGTFPKRTSYHDSIAFDHLAVHLKSGYGHFEVQAVVEFEVHTILHNHQFVLVQVLMIVWEVEFQTNEIQIHRKWVKIGTLDSNNSN